MSAPRFHVERHIAAPPDRVWALLSISRGYRDWNPIDRLASGRRSPPGISIALVATVNPERTFALKVSRWTRPASWSGRRDAAWPVHG